MIYKVDHGEIRLRDSFKNSELKFPIEQIQTFRISINHIADKIAVLGKVDSNASRLCVIDLKNYRTISELKDVINDFQWYGDDTILFSDGKSIYSFHLPDKKLKELTKFSRIRIAPIGMSISPDLSKIAFYKWKGDDKKLCILNIYDSTLIQFKPSMYSYWWFGNDQILYNLGDGLKRMDIRNGKSVAFIKNPQDLLKKSKANDELGKDLMNIAMSEDLIVNEISNPKIHNGRLYCEIFLSNKTEKRIGVISLKFDFSDLTFHFYKTIGLINDYYVLNNPNVIGVHLKPNTLIGETIESGLQYFDNNERTDVNGYKPCWTSLMPT
jgi:hypothetical protein